MLGGTVERDAGIEVITCAWLLKATVSLWGAEIELSCKEGLQPFSGREEPHKRGSALLRVERHRRFLRDA